MTMKKIWLCIDRDGLAWGHGTKEDAEDFARTPTDRVVQFQPVPKTKAKKGAKS
jgi:hypothetical protein